MSRPKTLKAAVPGLLDTFRYLRPYTRKHSGLITGSFAALFASVAFRALEPWPLQLVIDYIIMPGAKAEAHSLPFSNTSLLLLATGALVLVMSGRAFANYTQKVGFALVGNRVLTEVRGALYRHLQNLSLSFHNRAKTGDLIVRVISDIGMLKDMAVTALMPLIASVLLLVAMTGLMFWINWQLTLVVLLTIPLYWLPTIRLSKRIQHVSRDQRKREGAMASTAAESMGAIQVVQALSLEEKFIELFAGQNKKSLKEGVKAKRLAVRLESTVQIMIAISTALVLWFGTHQVLKNALSPGELIVFLSYLKAMFKPMQDFAKYAGRLAKASAAGERIIDLFQQSPDVTNSPYARAVPALTGHVAFRDVSFAYEPGHPVLHNISFTARPGETIALVGPSGNGKSTTVSLIPRLYNADAGRILFDGIDIRDIKLESLRSQMSIVLQNNLLFAASVRENIAYGAQDVSEKEIHAAAKLANAHDFILSLPDGYDTVLGERGATVSAGQRQRIAIARAAIRNAPMLILDEPATGLDEKNAQAIHDALARLAHNRTTFLITHDLLHAASADQILFIDKGCIAESGTHQTLMAAQGKYAAMYAMQQVTTPGRSRTTSAYQLEETA